MGTKQSSLRGEADEVIESILRIHKALSQMSDVKPCEELNCLFAELVEVSIKTRSREVTEKVLTDPRVGEILPSLRKICGEAEYELESHWAKDIIGNGEYTEEEVYQRLKAFPYFDNYIDLTRMELSAIYAVGPNFARKELCVAFLGSGPLPLTSLCLCGDILDISLPFTPKIANVMNIDHSPSAITLSRSLCVSLGGKGARMDFVQANASDVKLENADVVYIAALVGDTQMEKEEVLVNVVRRMTVGCLVVIRGVERLRGVLYSEFDPTTEAVRSCLEICMVVSPYNHVVNSIIVGRVKERN